MLDLLDPHVLFAEDTPVDTTFRFGATGLGRSLDAGCSDRDVAPGTQTEVPLWLTRPLLRRSMATIRLPIIYSDRYKRKLNAGADCVSLRSMVSVCEGVQWCVWREGQARLWAVCSHLCSGQRVDRQSGWPMQAQHLSLLTHTCLVIPYTPWDAHFDCAAALHTTHASSLHTCLCVCVSVLCLPVCLSVLYLSHTHPSPTSTQHAHCLSVLLSTTTQAPYFYEVGNMLNELWERSPTFSDFLTRTFRTRYYELISKVRVCCVRMYVNGLFS